MTTVIDERVVEMRFNNADFEKNVAQSMETLQKLKDSLNFDSAKSLESIGKASKNFSMANVGNQIETVQAKFSALQVVGMTALSELTKVAMNLGATLINKVFGPITSGGMNRALNIESAKFQLEGLHVAWESIKDDLDYAVSGTAYGLDAAAKTAAQLVASNVQVGDSMKTALRAISGVAAMTNSSYEEISPIFTTIAGQGKLMTMQLRQLEARGLNAAATLAKSLGTTEAAIREMVKNGEIDFATFSQAMDDAFGEHAKDANKTFQGAMKNVRSALARIGEKFATPYMENMRKIFVNLIDVINHVKNSLEPVYAIASRVMQLLQEGLSEFLTSSALKQGISLFSDTFAMSLETIAKLLLSVGVAFKTVFNQRPGEGFLSIAEGIHAFVTRLHEVLTSNNVLINIMHFFRGIFNVGKLIVDIFKSVLHAIFPVIDPAQSLISIIFNILGFAGRILTFITTLIRENISLGNVLNFLGTVLATVGNVLMRIAGVLVGGIIFALRNFGTVVNWAFDALKNFTGFVVSVFGGAVDLIASKIQGVTGFFRGFASNAEKTTTITKKMEQNYGAAGAAVAEFGVLTRDATEEVENHTNKLSKFEQILVKIKQFFATAVSVIGGGIALLLRNTFTFFTDFRARFASMSANARNLLDFVKAFFNTIASYIQDAGAKISELFSSTDGNENAFIAKLKAMGRAVGDFVKNLGTGRIAALLFAAAIVGLVAAIIKVATSVSMAITAVRRVFTTIETLLKSRFFNKKQAPLILQLAEAFAIMAASLALLTMVDQDNLERTAKVMLKLLVVFTACAAAIRIIDFVISKLGLFSNFKLVNSTVLALAVSLGILVAAFAVLNELEVQEGWVKKLGIMALLFTELVAAATIVSKLAPKLAGGSLLLLSLAFAMKLLVDAFSELSNKQITNIEENIVSFTGFFIGIAALIAAAGRVRLTSAIGLYLVAKSINVIMPALIESVDKIVPFFEAFDRSVDRGINALGRVKDGFVSMLRGLDSFFNWLMNSFTGVDRTVVTVTGMIGTVATSLGAMYFAVNSLFAVAAVIKAIASLHKLLIGFGVAVIGLALAVKIVTGSVIELGKYVSTLDDMQFSQMIGTFVAIAATLGVVIGIVTLLDAISSAIISNTLFDGKRVRSSFLGMAAAFVGIALAISIISKTLKKLETLPEDRLWSLVGAMSAIIVAVGVASAGAGLITKGFSSLMGLIGIVGAVVLLVAAVGIISTMWTPENEVAMKGALTAVGVIMGLLSLTLFALSRLKHAGAVLSLMAPLTLIVIGIGTLIAYLGSIENFHYGPVIAALVGINATLLVLGGVIAWISKSVSLAKPAKMKTLIYIIGLVGVTAAALIGVTFAMHVTSIGTVIAAFAFLSLMLAAVAGVFMWISKIKIGTDMPSRIHLLWVCTLALGMAAVALAGLAFTIKHAGLTNTLTAWGLLTVVMIEVGALFAAVMAIRSADDKLRARANMLGLCIVALGAVAVALGGLAWAIDRWNIDNFRAGFIALAVVLGELGGLLAVVIGLGSLVQKTQSTVAIIGSLISMIGVIWSISGSLMLLSQIDSEKLRAVSGTLLIVTGIFGVLGIAIGALQAVIMVIASAFGSAAGAWAGAIALPAAIVSVGASCALMGVGLKLGAEALDIIALALEHLIKPLREIGELNCKEIAEGLIELGKGMLVAALGLGAFGVGGILGGVGLILVASGLKKIAEVLPTFSTELSTLQNVNLEGIAEGMLYMALASAALGSQAGSLASYAAALSMYNGALGAGTTTGGGNKKNHLDNVTVIGDVASAGDLSGVFAKQEEQAETHSQKMETYGAEAGQNYISGEVTAIEEGVTDLESSYMKVADAGSESYKIIEDAAKAAGQSLEDYVKASGGAIDEQGNIWAAKQKTLWDNFVDGHNAFWGDVGNSAKEGAKAVGAGAMEELTASLGEMDLNTLFGGITDEFAAFGQIAGLAFGEQAGVSAMLALNKMLGSFDSLFKQSGLLNFSGKEISQYGAYGMPTDVMNNLYGGVASTQAKLVGPNGIFGALTTWTDDLKNGVTSLIPSFDDLGGAIDGVGGKAGKASKSTKDFMSSMVSTIENQLNIFTKFETKQEITAQQMLDNMKSNIDGFASWSHRLAVLAERGIDQALYQKLAEMGPQGYETVAAFVQMTDEQLQEANQLFATSLTLPQSQADIVGAGFQYAGEMATQGFSNALDEHDALHESIHGFAQDAIGTLESDLGIASPSVEFFWRGYYCVMGFRNGVLKNITWATQAITQLATSIKSKAEWEIRPDIYYTIGKNAIEGLLNGISDSDVNNRLDAKIAEIASKIEQISTSTLDENSPSKVMRRVGRFATLGLAVGLTDAASNVEEAAASVATTAIDSMSEGGRIIEALGEGIDFNPIITPMLDLSILRAQMNEVNAMFNGGLLNVPGSQNGGQFTAQPEATQQINFTQNNYSPKELSRIDIYRDTKNQISMMKGVMKKANA